MKPPIKDTPKENKPPNKGQAESTLVYTLYRKSPLKEDNLSTKDKMTGPESVLIKIFHLYLVDSTYPVYFRSLASLSVLFGQTVRGLSAGGRVFEYMELQPRVPLRGGHTLPINTIQGVVRFENVSFAYPSRADQVSRGTSSPSP